MLNPAERISFLIASLENGRASIFARKCDIAEATLSKLRNGKMEISMLYYSRILRTYPEVRQEWLLSGVGAPTRTKQDKDALLVQIAALREDIREIKKLLTEKDKS